MMQAADAGKGTRIGALLMDPACQFWLLRAQAAIHTSARFGCDGVTLGLACLQQDDKLAPCMLPPLPP